MLIVMHLSVSHFRERQLLLLLSVPCAAQGTTFPKAVPFPRPSTG